MHIHIVYERDVQYIYTQHICIQYMHMHISNGLIVHTLRTYVCAYIVCQCAVCK
jgi:hypothetical protein